MYMKSILNAATVAALSLAPIAAFAQSDDDTTTTAAAKKTDNKTEVGKLTCHQTDRTNLVLYTKADFDCTFESLDGKTSENYTGRINKVGVDLTAGKVETIVWYVFSPTFGGEPGGLEGNYVGGSADGSLGVGIGARILVGGLDRSFALQPASVSGSTGLGLAAGIEKFRLKLAI